MHKKVVLYPGKISGVPQGPLGYLLQDPLKEVRLIKNDPKLRDKSASMREDLVCQNALTVIYQRGGGASDKKCRESTSCSLENIKEKSFRWLLENDVGYTIYLIKNLQNEEATGVSMEEGHSKESIARRACVHLYNSALSFVELKTLMDYEASRVSVAAEASEDDQLVGFGSRAKSTWKEIWDGRGDGYADFIVRKSCSQGTRMHKLQQYLRKKQQSASATTNAPTKQTGELF
ncbi:unnamed protein product [Oreochromis niloticus]|nr:unnamed protein product [Mustela putorius furo]